MKCINYCPNPASHKMKLGIKILNVCKAHYFVYKKIGYKEVT